MSNQGITFDQACERLAHFKLNCKCPFYNLQLDDILALIYFAGDEVDDTEKLFKLSKKVKKVYNRELIRQGFERACPVLGEDYIDATYADDPDYSGRYKYTLTLEACQTFFPLLSCIDVHNNHEFMELLKRAGLLERKNYEYDSEAGGSFFYFATREDAVTFLGELNETMSELWQKAKEQFLGAS